MSRSSSGTSPLGVPNPVIFPMVIDPLVPVGAPLMTPVIKSLASLSLEELE
jgi:hypothetical protein